MKFTFAFDKYIFRFARKNHIGHFHGTRGACAVSTVALPFGYTLVQNNRKVGARSDSKSFCFIFIGLEF